MAILSDGVAVLAFWVWLRDNGDMPTTSKVFEDELSFEPCYAPGSSRPIEAAVLRNTFGDGYTQVVKDGINNVRRRWNLQLEALTPAEWQELDAFLKDQGGWKTFLFQPPGPEGQDPATLVTDTVTVHCPKWTPSFLRGGHVTVQLEFVERFV